MSLSEAVAVIGVEGHMDGFFCGFLHSEGMVMRNEK
jgi:hypothetical protein